MPRLSQYPLLEESSSLRKASTLLRVIVPCQSLLFGLPRKIQPAWGDTRVGNQSGTSDAHCGLGKSKLSWKYMHLRWISKRRCQRDVYSCLAFARLKGEKEGVREMWGQSISYETALTHGRRPPWPGAQLSQGDSCQSTKQNSSP